MFDKADDELIQRLIKEAEAIIEEELQKRLAQESSEPSDDERKISAESNDDLADDVAPPKKRRGRPRKKAAETSDETASEPPKAKSKKPFAKSLTREKKDGSMAVKEAILEFVEREDGVLALQEVGREHEPMVMISFSEQAKDMIGRDEIQAVGQSMIHAAIASIMQRQMSAWHAHVYDEKPKRFS